MQIYFHPQGRFRDRQIDIRSPQRSGPPAKRLLPAWRNRSPAPKGRSTSWNPC
jgi:hypothetical protein